MSLFSSHMFLLCLPVLFLLGLFCLCQLLVCCWLLALKTKQTSLLYFLALPLSESTVSPSEPHLDVTERPLTLISISNTSSGFITFMGVSWRGPACHFSVLTSSHEQRRRREQINLILFFITLTSFFTALWWDEGANLGGVWRFTASRSVQAIKAQRPANEHSVQSHRDEYSMHRAHRSSVTLWDTYAVVWPRPLKGQPCSSLFSNHVGFYAYIWLISIVSGLKFHR